MDCYILNYERYAREVNDDFPIVYNQVSGIADVNVNGTDVCVISHVIIKKGEEFDLANGFACDCSDPENFDFEDNGRFFDSLGFLDWNFSNLLKKIHIIY